MGDDLSVNDEAVINGGIQWYYRGSIKSCNYSCGYCPFSKRKASEKEIESDRQALVKFVDYMLENLNDYSSVMVVPYGEALIHKYYWEELARLSRHEKIELAGAQTNLSFPAGNMIDRYKECGGSINKLRLWGTFHPDMVSVDEFAGQCEEILSQGVLLCAGCVGVPENIDILKELRKRLPENIYLWVNKMDGIRRNYTIEEKKEIIGIDPYFENELWHYNADIKRCRNSRFVNSSGDVYRCNLSRRPLGNLYNKEKDFFRKDFSYGDIKCDKKECSCYISYCNLHLKSLNEFEPYPAFRIPQNGKYAYHE